MQHLLDHDPAQDPRDLDVPAGLEAVERAEVRRDRGVLELDRPLQCTHEIVDRVDRHVAARAEPTDDHVAFRGRQIARHRHEAGIVDRARERFEQELAPLPDHTSTFSRLDVFCTAPGGGGAVPAPYVTP